MPIPVEIVEPTVSVSYRILSLLLKAQVSVFAFGAEKTGKTSFVRRLEGRSSLRDIFSAGESSGVIPEKLWVHPTTEQPHSVRLLFIDVGGHKEYLRIRRAELARFLPLGVLLFLDHRAPTNKGPDDEQIDNGSVDPQRMKRHKEIFNELISSIQEQPQVRKACQALVIVINKSELWQKNITKESFQERFRPEIARLMEASGIHKVPPLIACSVKTGEGIPDVIKALFKLSGWEVPLIFGKKIRIKASLWK